MSALQNLPVDRDYDTPAAKESRAFLAKRSPGKPGPIKAPAAPGSGRGVTGTKQSGGASIRGGSF